MPALFVYLKQSAACDKILVIFLLKRRKKHGKHIDAARP